MFICDDIASVQVKLPGPKQTSKNLVLFSITFLNFSESLSPGHGVGGELNGGGG